MGTTVTRQTTPAGKGQRLAHGSPIRMFGEHQAREQINGSIRRPLGNLAPTLQDPYGIDHFEPPKRRHVQRFALRYQPQAVGIGGCLLADESGDCHRSIEYESH